MTHRIECDHTETTTVDVPAMGWGKVREQYTMCVRCLAIVTQPPTPPRQIK